MDVEDCADISRAISAILDVHDPIPGTYTLEVTSPGIDRPLVRLNDYERFAGHLAKMEVEPEIDGRRRFKATIVALDGDDILIEQDGQEFRVPFSTIRKARLVLTDALIKAALRAPAHADEVSPEGGV
jgi:ribosome maturation factor RimP